MRSLWMILFLAFTPFSSFAAEPFARATIEDGGNIVPGQQVRLDVTVFAPEFFTSPPQFPLFDLPNAMVTLPDERAQNVVETVDGVQYSGIRRVYAIVPETWGDFSLPSVSIELGYSVDGKAVNGKAQLPAFGFTVVAGSGQTGDTLTFAARNLTLTQSFDRDPASLRVGEALVRTITVFAEDTQAMMIPAVEVGNVAGMRQYAATSQTADNISVGRRLGSRRVQTVTYTAGIAGSFVMPQMTYAWYDLDGHRHAKESLPETKISVAAASSTGERIAPQLQAHPVRPPRWPKLGIAAAVLLIFTVSGWLLWQRRSWLLQRMQAWLQAYRNSDRYALVGLKQTIRTGRPKDIEAGLRQWLRRKGCQSLTEWSSGTVELHREVERLQRSLYSGEGEDVVIDRKGLERAVSSSTRSRIFHREKNASLPALNPREPLAQDHGG